MKRQLHVNYKLKRFKIYHLLMLVEFQRDNGQVVSIATRQTSAVLNKVAAVMARSLRSNVQVTRGYVDRQQSDAVRIFFVRFKLISTSFATSLCSNFVWRNVKCARQRNEGKERSIRLLYLVERIVVLSVLVLRFSFANLIEEEGS